MWSDKSVHFSKMMKAFPVAKQKWGMILVQYDTLPRPFYYPLDQKGKLVFKFAKNKRRNMREEREKLQQEIEAKKIEQQQPPPQEEEEEEEEEEQNLDPHEKYSIDNLLNKQ
ncbi:hypothetical protein M9Y10_015630 [Tritrichomonas musculus]|uniref:Uncharacterized protein n=2 Tax=Tritrichomonas musculus TaxID=1915356 RepID=A0ABR2L2T4_9EUKA